MWRHSGVMDLSSYVDTLRHELAVAARSAGPDAETLAERLTAPLESATRLVLQEAVSDAAQEISRDLAPGSVDVRLRGRELGFVVDRGPREGAAAATTDPAGWPPAAHRAAVARRRSPGRRRREGGRRGHRPDHRPTAGEPQGADRGGRRARGRLRQRLSRPDPRRRPAAGDQLVVGELVAVRQPAERVGPVTGPQDAPRDAAPDAEPRRTPARAPRTPQPTARIPSPSTPRSPWPSRSSSARSASTPRTPAR